MPSIQETKTELSKLLRDYKQPASIGGFVDKYINPLAKWTPDSRIDRLTGICSKALVCLVGVSAVIMFGFGVFVAGTYILSLAPALGVVAGTGSLAATQVSSTLGVICLYGAVITAVPATVNGISKAIKGNPNKDFELNIKREIETLLDEVAIKKAQSYAQYGLGDKFNNYKQEFQSEIFTFINTHFPNRQVPATVISSLKEEIGALITDRFKDIKVSTSSRTERLSFDKILHVANDLAKCEGEEAEQAQKVAVNVFNGFTGSNCNTPNECQNYLQSNPKVSRISTDQIDIAHRINDALSSSSYYRDLVERGAAETGEPQTSRS